MRVTSPSKLTTRKSNSHNALLIDAKKAIDIFAYLCYIDNMKTYKKSSQTPLYSQVHANVEDMPTVANNPTNLSSQIGFDYVNVDYPKLHTHTHWEMFIVLSGAITHDINGQTRLLNKGDAYLIRPDDAHRLYDGKATETGFFQHINLYFEKEFFKQVADTYDGKLFKALSSYKAPLQFTVSDDLVDSVIKQTIAIQTDKNSHKHDFCCKLVFQELFVSFLKSFVPDAKQLPEWLINFLSLLQKVSSFTLSMTELAQATNYSYSRLSRIFKQYMGQSLVEYSTEIKIKYVKSLLANTDMSMLDIASKVGLTLSYFDKLFKKVTGITPYEYRQKHKLATK